MGMDIHILNMGVMGRRIGIALLCDWTGTDHAAKSQQRSGFGVSLLVMVYMNIGRIIGQRVVLVFSLVFVFAFWLFWIVLLSKRVGFVFLTAHLEIALVVLQRRSE